MRQKNGVKFKIQWESLAPVNSHNEGSRQRTSTAFLIFVGKDSQIAVIETSTGSRVASLGQSQKLEHWRGAGSLLQSDRKSFTSNCL